MSRVLMYQIGCYVTINSEKQQEYFQCFGGRVVLYFIERSSEKYFICVYFLMELEVTKRKRDNGEEDQEEIDVEDIDELPDGKKEEIAENTEENEDLHFKRKDQEDLPTIDQPLSDSILEKTEVFEIKTDPSLFEKYFDEHNGKPFTIAHKDFHLSFIHDIDRMKKAGYCDEEKVLALWDQKSRY